MKDIQNLKDERNVDIQKVGIKHLELPLIIQRKNSSNQVVYSKAKVNVSLPRDYKGTHMSRFVEVLTEWRNKNLLGVDIKGCLEEIIKRLEAKGFLICAPSENDRRYKKISCTEKSRGIHKEIAKKEALVVKEMCKDFTPEQMEAFLQMTEMMLQNIS